MSPAASLAYPWCWCLVPITQASSPTAAGPLGLKVACTVPTARLVARSRTAQFSQQSGPSGDRPRLAREPKAKLLETDRSATGEAVERDVIVLGPKRLQH